MGGGDDCSGWEPRLGGPCFPAKVGFEGATHMLARLAVSAVALIALTACAGVQSAGRNARSSGPTSVASATPMPRPAAAAPAPTVAAPPPMVAAPPPARTAAAALPPPVLPAPRATPLQTPPPQRAAPAPVVASTPPPIRTTPNPDDDEVVVPGQVERQVRAPAGDPRSVSERMQDINAWDRCVTHVQAAFESDPMRAQLDSPEDYCAQSLGMSNRNAVPESRRQQR